MLMYKADRDHFYVSRLSSIWQNYMAGSVDLSPRLTTHLRKNQWQNMANNKAKS